MLPGGKWSITRVLRKSRDFDKVFRKPDFRKGSGCFLVLARKNELGVSRLGMVVSKKNVGLAVERNRIKRLIRESFRKQLQLYVDPGMDVVFLAQKGSAEKENKVVSANLEHLIHQMIHSETNTKGV